MESQPRTMRAAVKAALDARPGTVDRRDVAGAGLALRYAQLVDNAAPAAKYTRALRLVARACAVSDDPDVEKAFDLIRDALAAHSVASDLGPKLLAVLDALGLTPKARTAGGKEGSGDQRKPTNPLDELRRKRAERRAAGRR